LAISLVAWSSTSDGPLVKRLSRCASDCTASNQNSLHHLPGNIGQPVIAVLKTEDQACVVDAELLQDVRLKVIHVHRVLGHVVAVVIGRTVGHTGFDAS